ncbi:hypothetical protein VP01_3812g2 [Puccinia sorghi]|uniref:Uncharacterized protein n=1 Tax=Puccinia sorghi TaxID=27349 RepID=A0A0L6UTC2_9BASI|nr:hypothetical protein VP01_3812g2 [Puccinia sorghi]
MVTDTDLSYREPSTFTSRCYGAWSPKDQSPSPRQTSNYEPSINAFVTLTRLSPRLPEKARKCRTKVGKHMLHLLDFNICYIHSSLSKLGLTNWAPNLDEQADSLYNVAHQMAAICTFRECVAGGAYTFMNHYVHFTWLNICSKEKKESGKHIWDEERKVLQTARERVSCLWLRDKRYKFAINNNFPKRYIEVIKPVQAHSNDEYFPRKQIYLVKKLPFRSEAANAFFRQLDDVMKDSATQDTKRMPGRHRLRVKNGLITIFPKAPKGLPLDFYDVNWFNNKLPAQRQNLANIDLVAFLPDPLDSLRFKDPLENIDLQDTDGEEDDDYEGGEEDEDAVMIAGGSGTRDADEEYEEFDEQDEEMRLEDLGMGTYSGGLADSNWNAWQ